MNKFTRRAVSFVVVPAVMAGGLTLLGASAAQASPQVNPIEEERGMCTAYNDENACKSLMIDTKMLDVVKNCLVKGAITGSGTLVVGRYVSKDLAEKVAKSTVASGATACLASLT